MLKFETTYCEWRTLTATNPSKARSSIGDLYGLPTFNPADLKLDESSMLE